MAPTARQRRTVTVTIEGGAMTINGQAVVAGDVMYIDRGEYVLVEERVNGQAIASLTYQVPWSEQ